MQSMTERELRVVVRLQEGRTFSKPAFYRREQRQTIAVTSGAKEWEGNGNGPAKDPWVVWGILIQADTA